MFIYFNGDSNMAGEELEDRSKGMAGVMAKAYGAEYVNQAVSGASNDRIYNTTLDYLEKNPRPDLMIIGWTEHGREQWYFNGEMHEINQLNVGNRIPDQFRRRQQFWLEHIRRNPEWHSIMGYYWHNKIYNLHTMLQEKEIPHLFFNIFFHFRHDEKQHLNWNGCYHRPYAEGSTYINWCHRQGFSEITPGWQHYDETAHQGWAQVLMNVLDKKKDNQ
jgi:hypothetical protein